MLEVPGCNAMLEANYKAAALTDERVNPADTSPHLHLFHRPRTERAPK
jgi:hypothetical protein